MSSADGLDASGMTARVACAVLFGPGDSRNCTLLITERLSASRAVLLGFLTALRITCPSTRMLVFSPDEYIPQAVCHWPADHERRRWEVPHGQELMEISRVLRARGAPVSFHCIPGTTHDAATPHNSRLAEAQQLAQDRLAAETLSPTSLLMVSPPALPADWPDPPLPSEALHFSHLRKVFTLVPRRSPVAASALDRTLDGLTDSDLPLSALTWEQSGYQPPSLLALRRQNLSRILLASSPAAYWSAYKAFTATKPRPPLISVNELLPVFIERMNRPASVDAQFDALRIAVLRLQGQALPRSSSDDTELGSFSRPFSVEEVEAAKTHIRKNCLGRARGLDDVPYESLLRVPAEKLRELFQLCVDSGTIPQDWLTAIVAAVKKPRKDGSVPKNYRAIGLESAFLKTLTLLIDRRMREWAESTDTLPDAQSGFRKGHRTVNNSVIMRICIEKARSLGRPLYMMLLDIENAFPSVDQAALWVKLSRLGAGGPLLDWLRRLYKDLRYVLRFNGECSDHFRAAAGILAGDPASPILWILFIADLSLSPHPDDVELANTLVNLLLIADDVATMSMSNDGIQSKAAQVASFCGASLLVLCVPKSITMVFNTLPKDPVLIHGKPVELSDTATYAGMTFTSTHRDIFVRHYEVKAAAARNVANTSLSLESRVGKLPPPSVLSMYKALIEPHLVYGCEAAIDVRALSLAPLLKVQTTYLRRALGVGPRSSTTPLYTETGIWPLRYRRASLTLRWLLYVVRDRPALALAAVMEAWDIAQLHGDASPAHASWWSDLCHSLFALPVPVLLHLENPPSIDGITATLRELESSLATHLYDSVTKSRKLPVIKARFQRMPKPIKLSLVCRQQSYLNVSNPKDREALTRLICANTRLGVEEGRHRSPKIPWHRRICRFCRKAGAVEDEIHALLQCDAAPVVDCREVYLLTALETQPEPLPGAREMYFRMQPWDFLDFLLRTDRLLATLARFARAILDLLDTVPPLILHSDDELHSL